MSGRCQALTALIVINTVEERLSEKPKERRQLPKGANRMPSDSVFFDRLVPIILVSLGVITIILILVAAGILLGII